MNVDRRRRYRLGYRVTVQRTRMTVGLFAAALALVTLVLLFAAATDHHADVAQLMVVQPPLEQAISNSGLRVSDLPKQRSNNRDASNSPIRPQLPANPQSEIRHPQSTPPATPTFNGRPLRKVCTLHMRVTAYSPDARCCGRFADGITASGYSVWTNGMKLVAADTHLLPFGTVITVPGYNDGKPVPVLDRGGKIKGHRLDVLYPTYTRARQWGVQWLNITVWAYAD